MTSDSTRPGTPGAEDDRLTQHEGEETRPDWDVAATDPRPTGAGAGETPEEGRGGDGSTRSNIADEGDDEGDDADEQEYGAHPS